MNPRICVCCGEPMLAGSNALSRNPNVCNSCSSLLDGIDLPGDVVQDTASPSEDTEESAKEDLEKSFQRTAS